MLRRNSADCNYLENYTKVETAVFQIQVNTKIKWRQ